MLAREEQLPYRSLIKFASLLGGDRVRKVLTVNIQHYCSSGIATSGDKTRTVSSTTRHVPDTPCYGDALRAGKRRGYVIVTDHLPTSCGR